MNATRIQHWLAPFAMLIAASASSTGAVEIAVTKPFAKDVQAAIDACPDGDGATSCQIRLPAGTIKGHWKIGGSGEKARQGVCLIGQGPGHASTSPGGKPGAAGTTLVYEGPEGGALLEFSGGDQPCVRNLSLAMHGAAAGIRLRPATGTSISGPRIENTTIAGDKTRPGGIGLQILGSGEGGGVEALLAQSLKINYIDVGIEVNTPDARSNRIGAGSKISAVRAAVRLVSGGLSLDGTLTQCRSPGCCIYELGPRHGPLRIRDGYHEIGLDPERGSGMLCLSDAEPNGSDHSISVSESYVNVQCNSSVAVCTVDLIRGRSNDEMVFRDNWIIASGGPGERKKRRARVALESASGPARLIWSGNGSIPILTSIGPGVAVEALRNDGETSWNDLDLDGAWDPGEPRLALPR